MSRRPFILLFVCALAVSPARAEVRIEISGANPELISNVRNHIGSLAEKGIERPRQLRRRLHKLIGPASEALGYYAADFDLKIDGKTVRIFLIPGEPVRWSEPTIEIAGEAAKLKAINTHLLNAPIRTGDIARHDSYERLKRDLQDTCREFGFLDAHYTVSELRVDLPTHSANATLRLDCGERYHFGAIQFSDSSLDPDLLSRLVPIKPGSPYRKRKISDLYRNLQNSHYFGDIDIETTPDAGTHSVAVNATVKDAPRHRFNVGVGFGTDTGPRTRLGWERPFVNSAGHSFAAEAEISQPIQKLTADYRIPLQRPLEQFVDMPAEWERKIIEDTDSSLGRIGAFYNDRFSKTWRGRFGANIEAESYRQGSEPRKNVTYLLPGTAFTELELPEGIDPLSGHKAWMEVWGSLPALGADTAFLRLNAGYKRLFGLGDSQLLVARTEVGAISTGDINQIPASQRFFTGGDTTVRGFDYESLSTTDAAGELIGGRYLNVASLDYSVKVAESWRAAVFVDAGRAYIDMDEPWHKAVGLGVRWLSPVGQIRVDIAFPVDEPDRTWRLHIFMGPPL